MRTLLTLLVVAVGVALSVPLSASIDRTRQRLPEGYVDADLAVHGARLRGFALGMEGLVADWYWMRSLQYIGDKMLSRPAGTINIDDLRDLNPRLLYPFLDNATTLDPRFYAAYSYGAVVLPAIDPEQAITLAKKGIHHNPEQWRLYQHLGYIYWKLGRYEEASDAYERGSLVPGASPFMKLMAAAMKTQGGSRSTARAVYREMLTSSDDENVRITAERRLNALASLDEREAIDRVLAEYREQTGRCPVSLKDVMPALTRVRLPDGAAFRVDAAGRLADPTGAPYLLDRTECRVTLDRERTGLPSE